ncbi:MAG: biotin--[acetyl-CoA-carboxylase] ligase [Fretibacterium sp.]|nr:biotin--[acetyl-CoA-carboxylase] ligase [Fretibacterium sp.]
MSMVGNPLCGPAGSPLCGGEPDILTEEAIRAYLSEDSPVRRVICLETVDSTNNYAKRLALGGAETGTLVTSDRQTAGRGRRGHSFASPPGTGIYMTLILRPTAAMEQFQMITAAAAVAVCLTLEEMTEERPLIKWVNDIYLRRGQGERKVCGILSEAVNSPATGGVESVVVGLGVNVTTRDFGGLSDIAGSLFPEGVPGTASRAQIAAGIAERLMDFAGRLEDPELMVAYRARSLLIGCGITYQQNGETFRGRAVDIDAQAGLVVETETGDRLTLRSGEVCQIRPVRD